MECLVLPAYAFQARTLGHGSVRAREVQFAKFRARLLESARKSRDHQSRPAQRHVPVLGW